ncbi:MAG: hypothetical protein LBM13_01055, partial [Candidatus Ancillula sp.]|nr:hypothetical protein [Candidatus Ancillula sp.]
MQANTDSRSLLRSTWASKKGRRLFFAIGIAIIIAGIGLTIVLNSFFSKAEADLEIVSVDVVESSSNSIIADIKLSEKYKLSPTDIGVCYPQNKDFDINNLNSKLKFWANLVCRNAGDVKILSGNGQINQKIQVTVDDNMLGKNFYALAFKGDDLKKQTMHSVQTVGSDTSTGIKRADGSKTAWQMAVEDASSQATSSQELVKLKGLAGAENQNPAPSYSDLMAQLPNYGLWDGFDVQVFGLKRGTPDAKAAVQDQKANVQDQKTDTEKEFKQLTVSGDGKTGAGIGQGFEIAPNVSWFDGKNWVLDSKAVENTKGHDGTPGDAKGLVNPETGNTPSVDNYYKDQGLSSAGMKLGAEDKALTRPGQELRAKTSAEILNNVTKGAKQEVIDSGVRLVSGSIVNNGMSNNSTSGTLTITLNFNQATTLTEDQYQICDLTVGNVGTSS